MGGPYWEVSTHSISRDKKPSQVLACEFSACITAFVVCIYKARQTASALSQQFANESLSALRVHWENSMVH